MKVLDTGCGTGRNIEYLMRCGVQVYGVDPDPDAIAAIRGLAERIAPSLSPDNFREEVIEDCSFQNEVADFVISNAVLHFARHEEHFWDMLRHSWRVLGRGGIFFCRLASTIGCADAVRPLGNRRFILPDASERFLVDEALVMRATRELGGELADPLKTTVVQNQRSMSTWVLRKTR